MFARFLKRQFELLALTFGFDFGAAEPRLQPQQFELVVGEFFAAVSVLLDAYQTQSFFQDTDLILCEFEPIPVNRQRAGELFEQRLRKLFLKPVYQLGVLRFKGSKTAAQLMKITNKYAVIFIVFS